MVLKEIFGDGARIKLLEELIDNWGELLTAEELSRMADVSLKSVYSHMDDLKRIGLVIIVYEQGSRKFKLSEDDGRAVALALMGSTEFLRKLNEKDISIEPQKEVTINLDVNYSLEKKH